jgi:hypothetical protein
MLLIQRYASPIRIAPTPASIAILDDFPAIIKP